MTEIKKTSASKIDDLKMHDVVYHVDLLEVQLKSFQDFFQIGVPSEKRVKEGLYKVFMENFPIEDFKKHYVLELLDYTLEPPHYTREECIERGMTYDVPLKATLRLTRNDDTHDKFENIEQEIFLGNIPYMTSQGSFIVNGVERVVVAQIHKSPGVFFSQNKHISGLTIYSAKVIPFKGVWIEFIIDVSNVMYAYVDRKKKIAITTLLRAIGYSSDKDILDIFDLAEEIEATKEILDSKIGRKLADRVVRTWTEDFVDEDTGEVVSLTRHEVLLERGVVLTEETIDTILQEGIKTVILHKVDTDVMNYNVIYNTLYKDNTNSEKEAIEQIYRQLRNVDPPDEQTAQEMIHSLLFSNKRYSLNEVGRYRINKKLKLDVPIEIDVLTKPDIIAIINYLIKIVNSQAAVDDIDHLGNRRVRLVGEQLYNQFGVGLARVARTIRERINVRDNEDFKPADLINARTLSSVINSFFGINPLSQIIDQINPLAELTHKRRVSALGPGGLSRERAGFEVRDVHHSHYGRLCTIETPEGVNIGLISSLCMHARVNHLGFIETPYRSVKEGKVDFQDTIYYLNAEEEDIHNIAPASTPLDQEGKFVENKVKVRRAGDFPIVKAEEVTYADVASSQIASVAAAMIPFLEHNDASRALMGANMQRQAVPLMQPEVPIVCTGVEKRVANEFRGLMSVKKEGVVSYVDATKIIIQHEQFTTEEEKLVSFDAPSKAYYLPKFRGTNRETCINLNPTVSVGEKVYPGQLLCEGYATQAGEVALGRNLNVAFMSWRGYNFEDAIVISERVVREDIFTSIHIREFSLEVKDTKFGEEELTAEIPNISEEALLALDEEGVVKVGTKVKEGDILVGKVAPKGEVDATPEAKLLKAIFGEKAGDVKDLSLKAPPSMSGVVINTKVFSGPKRDKNTRDRIKQEVEVLKQQYAKKLLKLRATMLEKITQIIQGEVSQGIFHKFGDILIEKGKIFTPQLIEKKLFPIKNIYSDAADYAIPEEVNLIEEVLLEKWTVDATKNALVEQLVENYNKKRYKIVGKFRKNKIALEAGDGLPKGINKLVKVYIANKRKLKVGDKMAGRHGNKGLVCTIVPQEDMPFLADGTPVDIVLSPLGLPSRMNLGQIYEAVLGWAGQVLNRRYVTPIFEGASMDDISKELKKAKLPPFGKTVLYDGLTGDRFDQEVTVGVIYMMKLSHLVDDKMHARSIGPYSLVTQQPLGGKSQFGGQRVGEMEKWSLISHGAAYLLREMSTIKSDDTIGRSKAYEAIVYGKNIPDPDLPESFKVLIHELRGLALEITLR